MYLTTPPPPDRVDLYRRMGLGVMLTPTMANRGTPGLPWAADTGCFKNPDGFDLGRYLYYLEQWTAVAGPGLFATAPDVLGDPIETWRRSKPVLTVLREHGYRAALVAQDGITDVDWDAFDCLFVGGSTEFKLSEAAYQLAIESKRRGKWAHMGRVNGGGRFAAAAAAGYDSADGTKVAYGPDLILPIVGSWLRKDRQQPSLWGVQQFDGQEAGDG